jgi:glycosyltransferase involved in cell wall biosynthesis
MRIAWLITQFPPSVSRGLGRYAEELWPHLAQEHDLTVYTVNDGAQPAVESSDRLTVHRPRLRVLGALARRGRLDRTNRGDFLLLTATVIASNWRHYRHLRSLPAEERPDVVAVHDVTNFLCGLLAHYRLRLPIVLHVHTTEYGVAPQAATTGINAVLMRLERWLGRIASRVIAATPEVKDQLVAAGWDERKIDVILLGSPFERLMREPDFDRETTAADGRALRARLGLAEHDTVLLFVGRLERQKGVWPLLDAMPAIAAAHTDVRLVLLGEGDTERVERVVATNGLTDHVLRSPEFVSGHALLAFYAMADLCIFPSLFEPFGLVAVEAMSLGKPVVLGDGFSRVFAGDATSPAARYVRSEDPADIARVVLELVTDPNQREKLAANGERFVREQLQWSRTAEQTLATYALTIHTPLAHQPTTVATTTAGPGNGV